MSIALSPYWMMWYTDTIAIPAITYCIICLIIGLCILAYADDEKMQLCFSIPISLYGFFIAATWIDTVANALVGLLQFVGTISRIPSSVLGLTVLAWGNSVGDVRCFCSQSFVLWIYTEISCIFSSLLLFLVPPKLSANLAMAHKGMPGKFTATKSICLYQVMKAFN